MQFARISLFPALHEETGLEIGEEIVPESLPWAPVAAPDDAALPLESAVSDIGSAEAPLESWDYSALEGQLTVDVYETPEHVVVVAPIAGVKPEDLDITLVNDLLTIRGSREAHAPARAAHLHQECYWGRFSRSLILPSDVRADRVKAFLKQGVLTIMLAKQKEARVRVEEVEL